MIRISVIVIGLFASTSAFACEVGDFYCLIGDIARENRARDEANRRRIHEETMENEAFLSRQKANDAEIDQQITNYYLRNQSRPYGY